MVHERVCARARSSVHQDGLKNISVYVCVRRREGGPRERRMEKEEKRHIIQMRETDEARRGFLRLPRRFFSSAFPYILAATPNARTPYRFVASRSLYSALLSLYFHYSLFREASSKFSLSGLSEREARSSAFPSSSLCSSSSNTERKGPRVCIRRNRAKPRRDIRALRDWIVKVDINSWIFPDIVLFSLLTAPHRAVPKYAPAENSHDTLVMKLAHAFLLSL